MKKVCLKAFGCKVNQYEAQVMHERLQGQGYQLVEGVRHADYLVVNTCTVTEASDKELEYFIRRTRRQNPGIKVLLAGCYVNHHRATLESGKLADGLVLDSEKHLIPEWIREYEKKTGDGLLLKPLDMEHNEYYGVSQFHERARAFVKIQDGCNKKCTFCIVTIVRGESRSRPLPEILAEVRRLAEAGYNEVVLTGIQVGAYGRDFRKKDALVDVIERVSEISGIERIRLSSIDPLFVGQSLLNCMRVNPKFCNHLHLSLQSGDDAVLKRMLRGYRKNQFADLIGAFDQNIRGFTFSTDVIVGFPGETENAFENTQCLVEELLPIKVHVFPYSDREGTVASTFSEKIPSEIKKERVRKMLDLSRRCFCLKAARFLGEEHEILVEGVERLSNDAYRSQGRLANYIPVEVVSPFPSDKRALRGVRLMDISENRLVGSFPSM